MATLTELIPALKEGKKIKRKDAGTHFIIHLNEMGVQINDEGKFIGFYLEDIEADDRVVIYERTLPKSWEEYCEIMGYDAECLCSCIDGIIHQKLTTFYLLLLLRDYYNDGRKPDWNNNEYKFVIENYENRVSEESYNKISKPLYFKTEELRDEFMKNFRDIIEKVNDLI